MSDEKRKHIELSQRLSQMHREKGLGAVLHETGEPVQANEVDMDPNVALIEGSELRPRKDVRAFMYRVPKEIKERPGTVVWSGYDEEENMTYLGTACVRNGSPTDQTLGEEGDN